jgi:hypothetical protein
VLNSTRVREPDTNCSTVNRPLTVFLSLHSTITHLDSLTFTQVHVHPFHIDLRHFDFELVFALFLFHLRSFSKPFAVSFRISSPTRSSSVRLSLSSIWLRSALNSKWATHLPTRAKEIQPKTVQLVQLVQMFRLPVIATNSLFFSKPKSAVHYLFLALFLASELVRIFNQSINQNALSQSQLLNAPSLPRTRLGSHVL